MDKPEPLSTVYYSDPLNDDFEKTSLDRPKIPKDYKFIRKNPINNFFSGILFWGVAHPVLSAICFLSGVRIRNRKNIKKLNKTGFFIYANHTSFYDAVVPQAMIHLRRRSNVVAFSDTLSMKFVKHIARALGYLPIEDDLRSQAKLMEAMKYYLDRKQSILIYPEAHIWPYYNGVREFKSASFHYPAKFNKPIIPIVSVFTKPRHNIKKPPRPTYIVGEPIYPREDLDVHGNREYLRNECYKQMKNMIDKEKKFDYYNYVYREKPTK